MFEEGNDGLVVVAVGPVGIIERFADGRVDETAKRTPVGVGGAFALGSVADARERMVRSEEVIEYDAGSQGRSEKRFRLGGHGISPFGTDGTKKPRRRVGVSGGNGDGRVRDAPTLEGDAAEDGEECQVDGGGQGYVGPPIELALVVAVQEYSVEVLGTYQLGREKGDEVKACPALKDQEGAVDEGVFPCGGGL